MFDELFISKILLCLLIVLVSIFTYASFMVIPLHAKKIKYKIETFKELKCNELGYFKKGKK